MKVKLPLYILAYIKTTSKQYDGVGYMLQTKIYDALSNQYGDDVHYVFDGDVCIGAIGGKSGGKHLPKRSTKENCTRYGIDYVSHVYCKQCECLQRVALCHKIPRCCFGALVSENLYLDCSVCNSHTSDTLDEVVKDALSLLTFTIEL